MSDLFPNETILDDDYPIYGNYLYVADGKPYCSDYHGVTVGWLKRKEGFKEVRRCNLMARKADLEARRAKGNV
jgi:hypothetical protein